jgi:hypothetical protein
MEYLIPFCRGENGVSETKEKRQHFRAPPICWVLLNSAYIMSFNPSMDFKYYYCTFIASLLPAGITMPSSLGEEESESL